MRVSGGESERVSGNGRSEIEQEWREGRGG